MLLPTELTLKTTRAGIRLFSEPIKESNQLFESVGEWKNLTVKDANEKLKKYSSNDGIRIKTKLKLSHATSAGLNLFGQRMLDYDMNYNLVNGVFYAPEDMTSMEISADVYVDRTSIEVFIDGGAYSYSMERKPDSKNMEGLHFWGNNIEVKELQVYSVKSIW